MLQWPTLIALALYFLGVSVISFDFVADMALGKTMFVVHDTLGPQHWRYVPLFLLLTAASPMPNAPRGAKPKPAAWRYISCASMLRHHVTALRVSASCSVQRSRGQAPRARRIIIIHRGSCLS